MTTATDTRFFPGYFWVSEREDCRAGLCVKADTHEAAADRFVEADRRKYWLRGKAVTVYVMRDASDTPQKFTVVL